MAANLKAFAAKQSLETGGEGFVAFDAKTALFAHYEESLGATRLGTSQRMVIHPKAAQVLINRYFGGEHGPHA